MLLAELTQHYVAAAPTHDDGRAYEYALRAARASAQRLAHDEAATYFDRALQLTDFQAPDPRRRMCLLLEKGEALARTNEAPAARSTLVAAFGLAMRTRTRWSSSRCARPGRRSRNTLVPRRTSVRRPLALSCDLTPADSRRFLA
jgi:hypothetical protein